MALESAGEQKYYDFIAECVKKYRMKDIQCIGLMCLGCVSLTRDIDEFIFIGITLIVWGFALVIKNYDAKKTLSKKLNVIEDKEQFFDQLVARDTVEFKDLKLLITNDYLLKYSDTLYIYKFSEMKNVRIRNDKLYLIDGKKNEYVIAVNETGKENSFDTACQLIAILI